MNISVSSDLIALLLVFKLYITHFVQVAIQFPNKEDLVYNNIGDKLLLTFGTKLQR